MIGELLVDKHLTLRDYFAAAALKGLLSDSEIFAATVKVGAQHGHDPVSAVCFTCYRYADAMVKASEATTEVPS